MASANFATAKPLIGWPAITVAGGVTASMVKGASDTPAVVLAWAEPPPGEVTVNETL